MRLIIDIPEDMYNNACNNILLGGDLSALNSIISKGTTYEPKFSYNDLEAMSIYGYPVKDLAILAQRMHSDGLDPQTLHNSNEDYLAGYRRAYEESNKALEDAFNKMLDNIPKDL